MIQKWIETEKMKRMTMDNVEEMGMFGLAHNCCYIDEPAERIHGEIQGKCKC